MTVLINTVKVDEEQQKQEIEKLNEWLKKKKAYITRIVVLKNGIRIYTA